MEIQDKILKGKPLTQEERVELVREIERLKANQKDKRYGLVWENHPEDVELMRDTHVYDIKELKELEIKKVKGQKPNLILEGDNLHSLEVLRDSGVKVDVIYIDPPYNTLNETGFAYNDKKVDSNDNFRHSKWLSFMEKRLQLARQLMEDDGVIFVSIDDNEQAQLKLLMDQVFGEQNFIANIIWQSKYTISNDSKTGMTTQTEYIMTYAREKHKVKFKNREQRAEYVSKNYRYNDGDGKGPYMTVQMFKKKNPIEYEVISPTGVKWVKPWNFSKDSWDELEKSGAIYWGKKGDACPRKKVYLNMNKGRGHANLLLGEEVGYQSEGGDVFEEVMCDRNIFAYPKPVKMIEYLIDMKGEGVTVLDFFAGSGTTGHAVMELNKEDGGNRRFILCTNNEYQESKKVDIIHKHTDVEIDTKKNGEPSVKGKKELEEFETTQTYQNLVERGLFEEIGICRAVTYERNKRVIEGYTTPKGKEVDGIPNNLRYFKVGLKAKEEISELGYLEYNAERLEKEIEIKEGMPSFEDKGFYSQSEVDGLRIVVIKEIFVPKELIEDLREYKGNIIIYVSKEIQHIDYNLQELKREKGSKLSVRGIKEIIR